MLYCIIIHVGVSDTPFCQSE